LRASPWPPAAAFAGLALLLHGYAGDHSDLAVQRALVAARVWPHGWPDDLVVDHAAAHPGALFDLLALAVRALGPGALPPLEMIAYGLVLIFLGRALVGLADQTGAPRAPLLLLAALPLALPGDGRLLHPALLARTAAAPLLAAALWGLLAGDARRAGLFTGLTLAVHPASGLGAAAAVAVHRPRALPWVALGAAPLLPWALLGADGAAPAGLLRLRLGHHLHPADFAPIGWAALLVILAGIAHARQILDGPPRAALRAAALAHAGVGAVGLGGALAGLPSLMRLHAAFSASGLLLLALPGLARRPALALPAALGLWLAAGDALPGGGWRLRWSPPLHAPTDARAPPALSADPWARTRSGAPTWLTVKDGGELAGGAAFAARWAARVAAACGPGALDPPRPGDDRRGWRRVAARCPTPVHPGDPE
jgi:hypothetical protein